MNNSSSGIRFDLIEWREQFTRIVLQIASVLGIFLIVVAFPTASLTDKILFISVYIVLLIVTLLPTPYLLRVYLLLIAITAIGVNAILAWGPWADGTIFLLATVVLASLLLDNRTDALLLTAISLFLISIAFSTQLGIFQLSAPDVPDTNVESWIVFVTDYIAIGIVIVVAANMLKRAFSRVADQMQKTFEALETERRNLENKVQERTVELETRMTQLRASTLTARAIAETQDIAELLKNAANLIAERFEYYHVGIFILDDLKRNAYLQASSSEVGASLLGQMFRLDTDRKNPLTTAIEGNRPIIITDLDRSNFVRDPNFPITRSRMIMPLSVRSKEIGAIDIHSDQANAFTPEDAEILQTLADLTAISFDNVRLLEETRNLLTQLETNTTFQTQRTWTKFTSRQKSAYQYTPAGVRPIFSQEKGNDSDGLYTPIILHGQEIGRIKLKKRKGHFDEWTDRERDLVEKISSQVALALENSRLVDEAQKNALRNQMIASFSSYVRETLDVDAVIQTAATELRKVFDLKEAEIFIGTSTTNQAEES
ncbi:MAG: GAF domain-containing protein [Anaerolineales bacterium]